MSRISLIVVLFIPLTLCGCNAYVLQGKVVRGSVSDVQLVYAGDERLDGEPVNAAEVRITRDPTKPNRHLVGRSRTDAGGDFTLVMDEFGTGWMQEQWLVQGVAQGFINAETLMQLPGKNSKWRLLVTLAPGVSEPLRDQDEIMQDLERFK
jgi:hypothetical protein